MTAIRAVAAATGRFVQLTNAAGQDRRLSLQARGIIYLVLSLPADTVLTAQLIEDMGTNGRESVRGALRELEKFGYLKRTRMHDGSGHWTWEQVLSDAPIADTDQAHTTGTRTLAHAAGTIAKGQFPQVAPHDGNPSDGFPSDKSFNTNYQTRNTPLSPPEGADTDAGALFDAADAAAHPGAKDTKPRRTRTPAQYSPCFETWWKGYPRRIGKGAAWAKYDKAVRELGADPDALLAAAQRYAETREGEPAEYTCHPATWLQQRRWEDDYNQEDDEQGIAPWQRRSATN